MIWYSLAQASVFCNADGVADVRSRAASSSGEHTETGKGKCMYEGLKIHKNISKISITSLNIFFEQNLQNTCIFGHF